jgi:hypothetical protein
VILLTIEPESKQNFLNFSVSADRTVAHGCEPRTASPLPGIAMIDEASMPAYPDRQASSKQAYSERGGMPPTCQEEACRHLTETDQRCLGYPKAIPDTAGHCSSMDIKSPISLDGEYRFYQGPVATCVANGIQAANFLGDRFLRRTHRSSSEIDEL